MVKASPFLRKRIRAYKDNLHIVGTASKFEPLGRDSDSMDGLNVHGAIVDEVHAHKSRDVWDLLDTATGSRRQPLMFGITTAGFDRQSLCYELHTYSEQVLKRVIEDDSFFGVIYTLDEGDDWENERAWPKANPNLGVSKKWDDMRRKAARAKEMPSALNNFLRLELNVWTQSVTKWVPTEKWRACGGYVDADGLSGRTCYGGLDLSSTTDISAFVLVFPPQGEDDAYQVLCRFWVPEVAMRLRSRRDKVPYEAWVRQGLITATPGEVIEYDYILQQIDEDAQRYDLAEVAFDRWGSTQISQTLENQGLTMVQFGQGFASMSAPMKELERMILAGELAHGGNPVLTWMADNLVARMDPAGNIKPDKEKSTERVDGMVALIMALDRATRNGGGRSVYEDEDIKSL
jgi:phage terminase large subunit-like protein